MTPTPPRLWIITGPRQVGKTRFCMRLINRAKQMGLSLGGVFCPPVFIDSQKVGIEIEDLKTGQRYQLAKIRKAQSDGLMTEHWSFNQDVMEWGNQTLADLEMCDLFILDELGPLEFNRGTGWQNGLTAIDEGQFHTAIVVIRPELVTAAVSRWPHAKVIEIPAGLNETDEENLQNIIFQHLQKTN